MMYNIYNCDVIATVLFEEKDEMFLWWCKKKDRCQDLGHFSLIMPLD